MRVFFAIGLTSFLCFGSLKKKSLSTSGALAAGFVGLSTASNDNLLFTVVLVVFFVTSSFWTKYQKKAKMKIDPGFAQASQRDWKQVLSNGFVGSVISLVYQYYFDGRDVAELSLAERRFMTLLIWAYIGFYGCCAADTWASELGALSSNWPILITTFKPVPPGTNGGVSKLGLLASFAGGAAVGLAADVAMWVQYFPEYRSGILPRIPYNLIGSLFGTLGSLIDSLLGATIQASYLVDNKIATDHSHTDRTKLKKDARLIAGIDVLDNNQVNVVASVLTTIIAASIQKMLF